MLTAVATLAAAALTLLAPLESQLKANVISVTNADVLDAKTNLGIIPLLDGAVNKPRIRQAVESIEDADHFAGMLVWTTQLTHLADTDPRHLRFTSPTLAERAFAAHGKKPVHHLADGVLAVAARYHGPAHDSYVVEAFARVDYVGQADAVVRSAFLDAALVGLAVALLLGITLSSRLLRRLRLLQDASRTLDERDLGTLVVPHDDVSDEIGELARAFATMHARLRQQEDARRAFVATASHELRTPLTSLDGMLELLADDLAAEPIDLADARTRVARAQQQTRRLSGLASDLLDLSRLDAQLELRSEPVELGETARAVAAEFDARAREREVALTLDHVGAAAWAQADPGSVARIVRILLDNALRVAPAGSSIEIAVRGDEQPAIEISDSGPGVEAGERELIFERFQRGRRPNDEGGFGLGLAIGSELAARMHGALVLLENGEPGATFRLTLPAVAR
ncbi:MAG: HAMP domain-containing sensor histidine kinase [Solirubrobacteraceae bacterium]